MKQLDETDTKEEISGKREKTPDIGQIVEKLKGRKEKYNGYLEEMKTAEETIVNAAAALVKFVQAGVS